MGVAVAAVVIKVEPVGCGHGLRLFPDDQRAGVDAPGRSRGQKRLCPKVPAIGRIEEDEVAGRSGTQFQDIAGDHLDLVATTQK